MKINTKLAIIASLISLSGSLFAQTTPTLKVSGIRVIRETIGEGFNGLVPFNTQSKGTSLALLIDTGGGSIIKIDDDASKLESFTDSSGADLMVKAKGFNRNGFGSFPKVSEDGKMALVEINAVGVPAKGADKVTAKGTLVIHTASKKKTVKSMPIELKKGTKFTLGGIELKITKAGKPDFGDDPLAVQFQTSNKAIQMLAGVKFYDSSGTEIESEESGSSSMGFGKKFTYGEDYDLKKAVTGKVIVEFEVWTDLKESEIPFDITAGVGG